MNFEELAQLVKFHRKKAGLSRHALADLADVGKTVVYDIEQGKATVQLQSLVKILTTLNIHIHFQSPFITEFHNQKT
jgi:HTH-type transcriptional regulator / antitoxin HipB